MVIDDNDKLSRVSSVTLQFDYFIYGPIIIQSTSKIAMTKRAASYDIDPVTYEEKERESKDNPIDPEGSHMIGRKIYHLKKSGQESQPETANKPSLNIPGFLQKKQQQAPKPTQSIFKLNLFGSSSVGSGLFPNLFSNNPNKTDQKSEQKKEGLFSNNLFQVKANSKPQSSIFANSSTSSIFGSLSKGSNSGSLFNNSFFTGAGPALSSFPSESKGKKQQQGEEEGDSAQLQQKQVMNVDPSKSTVKFDYEQKYNLLKAVKLSKYKKDKGDLIDNLLNASLLQDKEGKSIYLSIQLAATHKNIFLGMILPGKSQVRVLNNKSENIEVLAFTIEKEEKKLEKHLIRIQISKEKEEEDKEFFEQLKQVIEGKQDKKNE